MGNRARGIGLFAACVLPNLTEAAVLAALGMRAELALSVQANAPAPLGVFHDLRWLIVYQDSWWAFGLECLGLLVCRGLLTGFTVRLAWPTEIERPSSAKLVLRGILFSAGAAVVLLPWTALLFGMAVVSVSWLFLAAFPPVLVISLLCHHAAVRGTWWRHAPPLRSVGLVILVFALTTVAGAVCVQCPLWLSPFVAGSAGLLDAWAWRRLVRAVVLGAQGHRRLAPVAPAGLACLLSVTVGGTALGFSVSVPKPGSAQSPPLAGFGPAVLVAGGYGTSWDGKGPDPLPGSYREWRFSYRGIGPDGPLPYTAASTDEPLPVLARRMATQVDALHRRTGESVDIVAESEGSLVAEDYLSRFPGAPVSKVVLVSPLLGTPRVYYPPPGRTGWGVAGGTALDELSSLVEPLASEQLPASGPFMRSVLTQGPRVRAVLQCPPAGKSFFAILPLADAVASPPGSAEPGSSTIVPAFHGGLLGSSSVDGEVSSILSGHPKTQAPVWPLIEEAIRSGASTWQVPALRPGHTPARVSTAPGSLCAHATASR